MRNHLLTTSIFETSEIPSYLEGSLDFECSIDAFLAVADDLETLINDNNIAVNSAIGAIRVDRARLRLNSEQENLARVMNKYRNEVGPNVDYLKHHARKWILNEWEVFMEVPEFRAVIKDGIMLIERGIRNIDVLDGKTYDELRFNFKIQSQIKGILYAQEQGIFIPRYGVKHDSLHVRPISDI